MLRLVFAVCTTSLLALGLFAAPAAADGVLDPLVPLVEEADEVLAPLPGSRPLAPTVQSAGSAVPTPEPVAPLSGVVTEVVETVVESAEPATDPAKSVTKEVGEAVKPTTDPVTKPVSDVVDSVLDDAEDTTGVAVPGRSKPREPAAREASSVDAHSVTTVVRRVLDPKQVADRLPPYSGVTGPQGMAVPGLLPVQEEQPVAEEAAGVMASVAAPSVGQRLRAAVPFAVPGALLLLMVVFLLVQNRVDANDPRLREDEDLLFV